MPNVEGLAARTAALQILDAVLRRGQTLDSAASRIGSLGPPDHALAVAIAGETLRRMTDLDRLIDGVTRRPLPADSKARMVLRLALAQKIGLDTPDHALVTTALPLLDGGPRRLVHGVLGTLLRGGIQPIFEPLLPENVEERWSRSWGKEVVRAARRQISKRPPLDLTFAKDVEAAAFAEAHGGVSLAPNHVRLESSSVASLPDFHIGSWWVQDLAASLPARLIPAEAKFVLDLCAAPGGKTMQLAAADHHVTAVDSSASRLGRLRENLDRTGLSAALIEADAIHWQPSEPVDAILLDAPCSATGTFRRHPEVLYRATPSVINRSAELQTILLDRAASWLRPGGHLVYSVCSLEEKEGETVISRFLENHSDYSIRKPDSLPDPVDSQHGKWVRICPGLLEAQGGLDGFFMVRLVRGP